VGQLEERDATPVMRTPINAELVLPTTQLLHEGVTGGNNTQRAERLNATHRAQPCLQPAVVGFDAVVGVLLEHVPRGRNTLVYNPRVDRRPVSRHLDRRRTVRKRSGEEHPRSGTVTALGCQHIDDLPELTVCTRPVTFT
jgi:hypothetical protein